MPVVQVNGVQLAYEEQGRGETLVFVHGSLEDYRSWRFQAEVFAERYRIIAYSRRYHFPNTPAGDTRAYSADLHAGDLAALIEALASGPVHLVTSSYGGYIALCMAAKRPELARTLVLGEPPIMPWLVDTAEGAGLAETFNTEAWQPAGRAFEAGRPEEGVRLFLNAVMGRAAFERMSATTRAMPMANATALAAETRATQFFSPFTCEDAGLINCPALLLDGERSPRLFYLISDRLAHCLPHATRKIIPGASHAMHLGNFDTYNAVVLAFLAEHNRAILTQVMAGVTRAAYTRSAGHY